MFGRLVSLAALALFLGCATTAAQPGGPKQDEKVAVGPKKKKNCRKELVTGSRLPQYVCTGDPAPHNVSSMDQQELRDRASRGGSPTSQRR